MYDINPHPHSKLFIPPITSGMRQQWLKTCYHDTKFQCWALGCPDEEMFLKLMNITTLKHNYFINWATLTEEEQEIQSRLVQVFSTNAVMAFEYCIFVLKRKRWLLGESAIATEAYHAYAYAELVIKSPWPPGEKAIASEPQCALAYSSNIIKAPWPPGEKAIAIVPLRAYWYAKHMLKGRFLEGEKHMQTNSFLWDIYCGEFNLKK